MKTKIPWFFTLFWSAITGLFLVIFGYGMVNQCRTYYFPTTVGTVDSIKQTVSHSSKGGTTYGIDITYHFTANDRRYDSTRLRYLQMSSSDNWSSQMLQIFPAGSHPTVYYNSADPSQAVLIQGIEGTDLFMAMFLTPFTLVMLLLWVLSIQGMRKTKGFMGLRILENDPITRIRPSCWMALGMGAATLGISAFASIFILAFGFSAHPSLTVAGSTWIVVLAIAMAAGLIKLFRIRTGSEDVVLDDRSAMLTAPKNIQVPYNGITGVYVVTKTQHSSKGGDTHTYEVWMHYKQSDSALGKLKLEKWNEQETEARRFAAWLGLRLNVPVEDGAGSSA